MTQKYGKQYDDLSQQLIDSMGAKDALSLSLALLGRSFVSNSSNSPASESVDGAHEQHDLSIDACLSVLQSSPDQAAVRLDRLNLTAAVDS